MPDPDAAPDPMDKAYAQAEAVLSDDAARAARRARVLAAIAGEPAVQPAESSVPKRRPAWLRGGWLVAASVAGLAALLTVQVYRPAQIQPPTAPAPPAAPVAADAEAAAVAPRRAPEAAAQAPEPTSEGFAVAPRGRARSAGDVPLAAPAPAPPPPPPPQIAQEPVAPAAIAPAPAENVVVTAQKRPRAVQAEHRESAADISEAVVTSGGASKAAPAPDFVTSPRAAARAAAKLRAAAAAGRTAELSALLDQGVPVDAPDADGETALMKSIQADQPAAAALLRRKGASLDRRNHEGDSARDMAAAMEDAEIDRALGLEP
jgi:hypothetical protein